REDTASRNFRLLSYEHGPLMLRLHVGGSDHAQIARVQRIQAALLEEGVFSDSPLVNSLIPYAAGENTILRANFRVGSAFADFAEIYPCAVNVSHFDSHSEPQLLDFARLLGRLQSILARLPEHIIGPAHVAQAGAGAYIDVAPMHDVYSDLEVWFKIRQRF